jgi:hypothetical protein
MQASDRLDARKMPTSSSRLTVLGSIVEEPERGDSADWGCGDAMLEGYKVIDALLDEMKGLGIEIISRSSLCGWCLTLNRFKLSFLALKLVIARH